MGLLDILNGMQNGPRGGDAPASDGKSGDSSGMSPITMAILGLLAYKAFKHLTGGNAQTAPADAGHKADPAALPNAGGGGLGGGLGDILGGMLNGPRGGAATGGAGGGLGDLLGGVLGGGRAGGAPGGGLSDLLKGGLGGILAGGAAGSVISGGLGDLLKDLQQGGQKDAADSWVGKGENKQIAPDDLANALGADQISFMSQQSGLPRDELLQQLSQYLPEFVNQATPDGRVPTEDEAQRFI